VTVTVFGGGSSVASDPCDPRGTAAFYYDADHTSDTVTACKSGGTITGTDDGATPSTDQNNTAGGSYSVDVDAADDSVYFAVTTGEFKLDEGSMLIYLYVPASITGSTDFFGTEGTAFQDRLYMYIRSGTEDIWVFYECGNGGVLSFATAALTKGQWNKIELEWSVTNNNFRTNINDGTWGDNAMSQNVPTTAPTRIDFGDESTYSSSHFSDTLYIDDVKIWTSYAQLYD
jgi:hypothetical protein